MINYKSTLIICAIAVFCVFSGCKKPQPAAQEPVLPAAAVKVLKIDLPLVMEYPAQAAGSLAVQVRAQASGILKARLFEEGSYVMQGTQLFQIDDAPYKIALESAQAALAQAQSSELQAKLSFERIKNLLPYNAVSRQDYDNAMTTYESAKANVLAARAQVNNAQVNLDYTKVLAPISGITGEGAQSAGSLIAASGESGLLTTMVQINPLYINFSMPTEQFTRLASGFVQGSVATDAKQAAPIVVEVTLPDGSLYPQTGSIIFFASTENQQTASISVKAALPNPSNSRILLPGQFVRVNLKGAVYKDAIVIPSTAVLATPMGYMVYTLAKDNTLEPRIIKAQLQNGVYIVSEGLKEGETIISEGLIKFKPKQKVEPEVGEFKIPSRAKQAAAQSGPVPSITGLPKDVASDVKIKQVSGGAVPLVSATTEVILPGTNIPQTTKTDEIKGE